MKKGSIAVAALLCGLSFGGRADPIFISGTLSPALTLTPVGSALEVSSIGFSGSATYESDIAVVTFDPMFFTTQPLAAGVFSITTPTAQFFFYTAANGSNHMTMTIDWNQLSPGGEVELDGTGRVVTSAGDSSFLADYQVGATSAVQLFFPTGCSITAGEFVLDDCGDILARVDTAHFEGGTVAPDTPNVPVPEPGTLVLIGAALAGMAFYRRRPSGGL